MGYVTSITGSLEIKRIEKAKYSDDLIKIANKEGLFLPPIRTGLSLSALDQIAEVDGATWWFNVEEDGIDADGEAGKAYEFESMLSEILEIVKADGCEATGVFMGEGEENRDIWRISVVDNKMAPTEKAKIVWADGTEVYK